MIAPEIQRMYDILVSFLGNSKSPLNDSLQLQFSCPRCQNREGHREQYKYHLEINLAKGFYNCWKCSSIDDSMHGSVYKLIRKYGTESLLKDYKETVKQFKDSALYQIHFTSDDFQDDYADTLEEQLDFPNGYTKFQKGVNDNTRAFQYLQKRGIDWPIIDFYHIGYVSYHENNKKTSNRIILPSFDQYGKLNYWTGRDFTENKKRQRYDNPKVDRKNIIFNEDKIQWNADITLVEGPFDSIVVPNSIPLLGKGLTQEYLLYSKLFERAHANINIFLDGDAIETAKSIYKLLNNGRLRDNIRFIYVPIDERELDPSKIFQLYGRNGIISFLNTAKIINEQDLIFC